MTILIDDHQQSSMSTDAPFRLNVELLDITDPDGNVSPTDDNCTSTCGACVTGAA